MDSCTVGHCLVRVDSAIGLLSVEEFLDQRLDFGDARRAAHKYNLVNFRSLHATVVKHLLNWFESVLEEVCAEFFKLGSCEGLFKVDAVHETFNEDLHLLHGRKVAFGLFDFRLEFLKGSRVLLDVNIVLLFKDLAEVVRDALVEIFSAKMRVSCRS